MPPKAFEKLYKPMPRRMTTVIKANGGLLDIGCDAFKHVRLQCILTIQLMNQIRLRNLHIRAHFFKVK